MPGPAASSASYLDIIAACNRHDPTGKLRFRVGGQVLGWVRPDFATHLARHGDVFRIDRESLILNDRMHDAETRSAAVATVLEDLRDKGVFTGWRDELFGVRERFDDPVVMTLDRGAVPLFGVRAYGVHVNGMVRNGDHVRLWIARRAMDRNIEPGKLDNMVAGGQPAGLSAMDNLVKEAWEEASIPPSLARRARPAGYVSYTMDRPEGLRRDVLFVYDLELPDDFTPTVHDDEVESFTLMDVETVAELVNTTDAFKFNCNLVIMDFLVRHGFLAPEIKGYMDIVQGLRQ